MKLERVLKLKTSGEDVKRLQEMLKTLGYYIGSSDGSFGQDTLVSVSNFQRDAGLKVDGIVNLRTWSRIINYNKEDIKVNLKKDFSYPVGYVTKNLLKIYDSEIDNDFFYMRRTKKNTIWLKNTLSSLAPPSYIKLWNQFPERDSNGLLTNSNLKTSSHYLIGGPGKEDKWDGMVIRNFDDNFWSYHSPFLTTDNKINQMSISIEISNLGPLVLIDNSFYTKSGILVDESEVVEVNFKGYKYWSKYSDKQIDSLRKLILFISEKHQIDLNKNVFDNTWFEYHDKWHSVGGLRNDSQISYDAIGIAPQKEIIEMLNSF